MGQEGPASTDSNTVDEVELANLSAERPDGETTVLGATKDGRLIVSIEASGGDSLTDALNDVGADEFRTRMLGVDANGDLAEVNVETLDANVVGTEAAQLTYLARALGVVGDDELRIAAPNPLDVSAAEVDVDIATQSLAAVTITDDGSFVIDAANQATLPTEQQTPVGVEDSSGTQVDPLDQNDYGPISATAGGAGAANAAALDLGSFRTGVDVFYDTSGAATITVEVSKDASTWRTLQEISPSSAASEIAQFDVSYRHIRAYIDQNLNTLEVVSKGG